jgi:ParB/RepB/Spo0J family partition protein
MESSLVSIAVALIDPNPHQPRKEFARTEIEELAQSIAVHGLIQPVLVHAAANGRFILHHGERRLRAFRHLEREAIPAIVKDAEVGDEELLVTALVENMQRVDMNPIEEARAILKLKKHGRTQSEIAQMLGISLRKITARLAWLDLAPEIQTLVAERKLPSDRKVSKAFSEIGSEEGQIALARKLAGEGRTIRSIVRATSIYAKLERGESVSGNYEISKNGYMKKKYHEKDPGRRRGKDRQAHAFFLVFGKDEVRLGCEEGLSERLLDAVQHVCAGCYLFEYDPELPCRECPLTKFLKELAKTAAETADEKVPA